MGQKVNPHGLRVGVIKDWDSRWFTSKREFGDTLVEDYKIRKVLKKQLYNAGVPKIEIERTIDNATSKPRIRVTIHCAKPGMVIGRQGAEKEKIQAQLSKMTGKDVLVNIVEVNNMSTNAQLVAEDIASQLERRIAFRRATKMAMRNAMSPRRGSGAVAAKGIKIQIGGRLNGADIARYNLASEPQAFAANEAAKAFLHVSGSAGLHREPLCPPVLWRGAGPA